MEIEPSEVEVHGTGEQKYWYASQGVGNSGQGVRLNYFADDEQEAEVLAHGLGIAHSVHGQSKIEKIGTKEDYTDNFGEG